MQDQFADMMFPFAGLSLEQSFAGQAPGTTPVGVNVRLFEPSSLRARGGSRPGLSKYPGGGVTAAAIQDLGVVLFVDAIAMGGSVQPPDLDPVTGLPPVVDPSSDGPPSTWGVGTPTDGVTGLPATDADLGTALPPFNSRNPHGATPGGGNVPPRKKRDGGDGYPPNPNVLVYRPESAGSRALFDAIVQIEIHGGAFDGQRPAESSDLECHAYNPGLGIGPTSGFQFPSLVRRINDFLAFAAPYSSYTVLRDEVSPPGPAC